MPRSSKLKAKSTLEVPPTVQPNTKAAKVITLLKARRGATLAEIMSATGWQAHSVRGFLSGTLRKRHGLEAISDKQGDAPRRYRLSS